MSVNTINSDKKNQSFSYKSWIDNIVNKGLMDDFKVLSYPDLVKIVSIEPDGQKKDYDIMARREITELIKLHSDKFEIIDLDLKKIELEDLIKSRKINNKQSTITHRLSNKRKTIIDIIKPVISPLKKIRVGEWVLIIIGIITIALYIILN